MLFTNTAMLLICIVSTASTTSMVFGDAPVYRYSMCNGTEYNFNECQLPIPDLGSTCPSFATVNCTEGLITTATLLVLLYDCMMLSFSAAVISRCYSDGEFRLSNASTNFTSDGSVLVTGRIEVCANYSFTSLCYQYWDPVDAQVFCRNYLNSQGYYSSNISEFFYVPSKYRKMIKNCLLQLATQLFHPSTATVMQGL